MYILSNNELLKLIGVIVATDSIIIRIILPLERGSATSIHLVKETMSINRYKTLKDAWQLVYKKKTINTKNQKSILKAQSES